MGVAPDGGTVVGGFNTSGPSVLRMRARRQRRRSCHGRQRRAGMRMGDRQAQRIGGVLAGQARQRQQAHHHFLHLVLAGVAVADDRLLQLQRGVFGHAQLARHQRGQRRAARLAEQQRALRVDVDEDDLHRGAGRLVGLRDLAHTVEDDLQPRRQVAQARLRWCGWCRWPRSACARPSTSTTPKPVHLQPRVDAEDARVHAFMPSALKLAYQRTE